MEKKKMPMDEGKKGNADMQQHKHPMTPQEVKAMVERMHGKKKM